MVILLGAASPFRLVADNAAYEAGRLVGGVLFYMAFLGALIWGILAVVRHLRKGEDRRRGEMEAPQAQAVHLTPEQQAAWQAQQQAAWQAEQERQARWKEARDLEIERERAGGGGDS